MNKNLIARIEQQFKDSIATKQASIEMLTHSFLEQLN